MPKAIRSSDSRVPADQAGYMELDGAEKDADCEKVKVSGGVSSQLGCCNFFDPKPDVQRFSCGNCEHMRK